MKLRPQWLMILALLAAALAPVPALGQRPAPEPTVVAGRVTDAASAEPLAGVVLSLEGSALRTLTDSVGRYRLLAVPPGPQVLYVRRIGYAPARVSLEVPASGTLERNVALARSALSLPEIIVTADPAGRARGELGTATVIDRDAIANQTAASLAGVLELLPGVPLGAPGLDAIQQIPLRSVPTSTAGGTVGPSAADLASFGTAIILDGVPLSNNANLQTLGPRAELGFSTSASGGVDLRRIPAATLERVEVIRGVPSARYGDLTQGAILVETRAGVVAPSLAIRYDARTTEVSLVGGHTLGSRQIGTVTGDLAHTRIAPGINDDDAYRVALQVAHRASFGGDQSVGGGGARLALDTRLDFYQLYSDNPEQPDVLPGRASRSRDAGLRLSERATLRLGADAFLVLTTSLDHTRQRSFTQAPLIRPVLPFTDRLDEGRAIGHYIGGQYISRVTVDGDPHLLYGRLEVRARAPLIGGEHMIRAGTEVRREWNSGPGYQFDIEFPPQSSFNGVQGFDRPRRYDAVPPLATSALYLDDRLTRALGQRTALDVQGGLRLDVLHRGGDWLSGARDLAWQPRLNVQVSPWSWLRLRAGAGRTAKTPSLASLYPAPQYFDVINVNWFANDPAERLAVLTTFIRDPTNPGLSLAVAAKTDAGVEIGLGRSGAALSLVGFRDRTRGAAGIVRQATSLLRAHYDLTDSTQGTGRPPGFVEPASYVDTVPVLLDAPANNLTLDSRGFELTALLPELRVIRTRLDVQASSVRTDVLSAGVYFGSGSSFSDFQLDGRKVRAPYWEGATRTGRRTLVTYRLVHHQPELGLVVTVTVQHTISESSQDVGGTDTLAFAGYVTRDGQLVPIPASQRGDSAFNDLHIPRSGLLVVRRGPPSDWLMSLQVSKSLPWGGRLSFYAFNTTDRAGRYETSGFAPRPFPPTRFGLELTMPLGPAAWR
jgi:hypothetical protein